MDVDKDDVMSARPSASVHEVWFALQGRNRVCRKLFGWIVFLLIMRL